MFEHLKYKNHLGQIINFGEDGIYLNYNDLRDYDWSPQTMGNKIIGFTRDITNKSLPIVIIKSTEEEAIAAMNRLFEVCEADVLAHHAGKVIIGNYYYSGFIKAKQNAEWLRAPEYFKTSLTLISDFPFWISERTTQFRKTENTEDENLDYPYDYPYDYYSGGNSQRIVNSFFAPVDFRLTIFGAVNNPAIVIGGHTYKVNTVVQSGEYLTIDSSKKGVQGEAIYLTQNNGTKVNKFDNRDRASYIFEPIPSGASPVTWLADFAFDLTLIEKRSEPPWT